MPTFPPDLVELEAHNNGYGQKGAQSHVIFPTSIASVPQVVEGLAAALTIARLEMES